MRPRGAIFCIFLKFLAVAAFCLALRGFLAGLWRAASRSCLRCSFVCEPTTIGKGPPTSTSPGGRVAGGAPGGGGRLTRVLVVILLRSSSTLPGFLARSARGFLEDGLRRWCTWRIDLPSLELAPVYARNFWPIVEPGGCQGRNHVEPPAPSRCNALADDSESLCDFEYELLVELNDSVEDPDEYVCRSCEGLAI